MHEPRLIYILVWVNAIEKSRLSANFAASKKSASVWIKVWVKARISTWTARYARAFENKLPQKLLASSKLPQCFSKAILYYKACRSPTPTPPLHSSSRCLVAVVKVVSCVDANANPGRQTNSTYCPLYRGRTKNIISRHKTEVQRCSSVWALLKYSVPSLHMGKLVWCLW